MYLYLLIFVCGSLNYLSVAADDDNIHPNVPVADQADCLKCLKNGEEMVFCPSDGACSNITSLMHCNVSTINTSDVCLQLTTVSPPITSSVPTTLSTTNPTDPSTTTTPVPSKATTVAPNGRHFDPPSFIGGIVLALGLLAIIYVSFKFYKARTERNYHIL